VRGRSGREVRHGTQKNKTLIYEAGGDSEETVEWCAGEEEKNTIDIAEK